MKKIVDRSGNVVPKELLIGMSGKTDINGIYVTWIVAYREDGSPWLGMVDANKVKKGLTNRLCQSCGLPLQLPNVFIGPKLGGVFFEPGLHPSCAEYSLKSCPHLKKCLNNDSIDIIVCSSYELSVSDDEHRRLYAVPLSVNENYSLPSYLKHCIDNI